MSYSAISSHIRDMYGIDISTSTITNITDKIIPKIKEFKERKNGESQTIPLAPKAIEILKNIKTYQSKDIYVFPSSSRTGHLAFPKFLEAFNE